MEPLDPVAVQLDWRYAAKSSLSEVLECVIYQMVHPEVDSKLRSRLIWVEKKQFVQLMLYLTYLFGDEISELVHARVPNFSIVTESPLLFHSMYPREVVESRAFFCVHSEPTSPVERRTSAVNQKSLPHPVWYIRRIVDSTPIRCHYSLL